MRQIENKLKKRFTSLIKEIARKKKKSFSGIGMLVYNSKYFSNTNCFSLRPSMPLVKEIFLGKEGTIDFLLDVASIGSSFHDGFIFFNEKGLLTHVAQYFFPPPTKKIDVNEKYGTRFHSALLGSYVKGVIITGGVNPKDSYYIFEKGKMKKGSI